MMLLARGSALAVLLLCLPLALWPLSAARWLPPWMLLPGALPLGLLTLAGAIGLASLRGYLDFARPLAAAAGLFGGLGLLAALLDATLGPGAAQPELATVLAARPGPLLSLGIVALGGALAWRSRAEARIDLPGTLAAGAAALFLLVLLGHLYGADALTRGGASSGLAASLLLLLALGGLALQPRGALAAYAGHDAGAVARRRLLPAAVLTPVASGLLLVQALATGALSPTLAVALAVFANVLVMLLLIDGVGRKVARVAEAGQARIEARAAAARRKGERDALTGLLNRRGWDGAVQAGERRCRSERLDAAIVVVDLDGLKRINDSQGHAAGDALIQRAAAALRKATRRGDALARLGGDEFACLAVGCDADAAAALVARFETALRAATVAGSVGLARREGRTLQQAFEAADQAMYRQKRERKLRRA